MNKVIRTTIFVCTFIVLTGCQYMPANGLFEFGPKDTQITQAVHQALNNNANLAPFVFHVETAERVVYLSGYVKTIRQSDTAEMIAKEVAGVRSVENNIIVRK